ncbi:hypothetical protein COCCADRAFT_83270 [Bipolaris zeicola 26-R-13]|uniref:Uncharacterized protein n=1 Tax=Cochliobolus carbonum (strain 26-R-13) TaxID=930089 RepID=W6Z3Z7_COCC2|nr:uncharacterized protein COCCADRAFT_83270 [Bipolaris zeicola 26-R-13]EUC38411.1 hypothetical protein COCCADRAFT_83270 [Bipolaris zeicola 26-R-13]
MVSCVVTLSGRVSQGQRARPEGCDGQPRAALAGSGRRDEHAPETKREVVCAGGNEGDMRESEVTVVCGGWAENRRRLRPAMVVGRGAFWAQTRTRAGSDGEPGRSALSKRPGGWDA